MLRIALEPEAASIYVQFLPIERLKNSFAMTKTGTKYMVVDIGGECFFNVQILDVSSKYNFYNKITTKGILFDTSECESLIPFLFYIYTSFAW